MQSEIICQWKLDSIRKGLKILRLLFLEKRLPSEPMGGWLKGAAGPSDCAEQEGLGQRLEITM